MHVAIKQAEHFARADERILREDTFELAVEAVDRQRRGNAVAGDIAHDDRQAPGAASSSEQQDGATTSSQDHGGAATNRQENEGAARTSLLI